MIMPFNRHVFDGLHSLSQPGANAVRVAWHGEELSRVGARVRHANFRK